MLAVVASLLIEGPAAARHLLVGDERDYEFPSEALAAVHEGDTVYPSRRVSISTALLFARMIAA